MANTFGRKWLAAILRNDELSAEEKEQQIMEGHIGVTDGLKDRIEELKAEADKAADLQTQLEAAQGGEDFKEKYEKEHEAFENFKKAKENEAEAAEVKAAYRDLLADEKISEKRIEAILRVTDFSKMKRDKDGKLENEAALREAINKDWSEFKTTVTEKGATVEKPPQPGKPTKTREEILAIKDTTERQKAIAENLQLFGKG